MKKEWRDEGIRDSDGMGVDRMMERDNVPICSIKKCNYKLGIEP